MVLNAHTRNVQHRSEQRTSQTQREEKAVSGYERNVRFQTTNNNQQTSHFDEPTSDLKGLSLSIIQLETIRQVGLPLIGASIEVNSKRFSETPDLKSLNNRLEQDAHTLSALVKTTMSLTRDVSSCLSINDPDKSVAVKLVLSSFVAPLVSDYYKVTGDLPNQEGYRFLTSQINSVLNNVDVSNWLSGPADHIYQQKIFSSNVHNASDEQSFSTNAIEASLPILQAVNRFSFGLEPESLVKDIMAYVIGSVQKLANNIDNKDNPEEPKTYNLAGSLIRSATQLYADCHFEEIERISILNEQEQQDYLSQYNGGYSLDPIIDAYDARMNMLQIIAEHLSVVEPNNF